MIYGIGTDILEMRWIRNSYKNPDDPFFKKSFSGKEKKEAISHPDPVAYFSMRFAGKEAVIKSLDINESIRLDEIEILESDTGRPIVELAGKVKEIAESKGIKKVIISMSSDNNNSIAFAIAEV